MSFENPDIQRADIAEKPTWVGDLPTRVVRAMPIHPGARRQRR